MSVGSHIELFAGVGMASIPLNKLGFETIATAETDAFCRSVLRARHPHATHWKDVRHIHASTCALLGYKRPLMISGGFPCQDVSAIGARKGITGARSGLWSEFARVIEDFKPEYVLIENVAALRARGMDQVLCDLCRLGYNARWETIPAMAAGAPHMRDRVFIVATRGHGEDAGPDWTSADCVVRTYHDYVIPMKGVAEAMRKFPRAGRVVGRFIHFTEPIYTQKLARANFKGKRKYPTPRHAANEWRTTRNAPTHGNGHGKTLAGEANDLERARGAYIGQPSESAGNINPLWGEWIMGLPRGWTDPTTPNDRLFPHDGFAHEPGPRTCDPHPALFRRGRLMALGNGVVPHQVELALGMLFELSPAGLKGVTI